MKRCITYILLTLMVSPIWAQDLAYEQTANPINLHDQQYDLSEIDLNNEKDLETLLTLGYLTLKQYKAIINFAKHQNINNVYQLQVLDCMDAASIQRLMKIAPGTTKLSKTNSTEIWYRYMRTLESKKGFLNKHYIGDPSAQLIRIKHKNNTIKFHLTAEKDAGEQIDFIPDYLSWGLQLNLANHQINIGDFDVNFGQGLCSWSGISFNKSLHIPANSKVKSGISPHGGTKEFGYYSGVAISTNRFNVFVSYKPIDARLEEGTIKSRPESGLHRTSSELAYKDQVREHCFGLRYQQQLYNINFGANTIYTNQNLSSDTPNLLSSLDFNYAIKNLYMYGEFALSNLTHIALQQGYILSLSKHTDYLIAFRHTSADFNSPLGQWIQNNPKAETGVLHIINHQIDKIGKLSWMFDSYRPDQHSAFAWDYTLQLESELRSNKTLIRFKDFSSASKVKQLRFHWKHILGENIQLDHRYEVNWSKQAPNLGQLFYSEMNWVLEKHRIGFRMTAFKTPNFANRIYAYEKDVLYYYSIPSHYGNGFRYYLNYRYKLNRNCQLWLKIAQWNYLDKQNISSGNDQIQGNKKTDIHLQLKFNW